MLRFITGLDPMGRREFLYSEIERCEGGAILVVPEQFSFESERLLGERRGKATDEAVEVLSFSRLCVRIFREYGGLAGDHVDSAAKLLLMSAALSQTADDMTFYTKRSHGPAFVEKLLKADSELCNAGAPPEKLAQIAEDAPKGVLKAKAADLSRVFLVYHALLDRGFLDPLEDIARAVKTLGEHDFFAGKPVFVDGFTGFTGSEYRLLGVMLEQSPAVTVALCCDSVYDTTGGAGLFAKTARTASRLMALAKKAGVKIMEPLSAPDAGYWLSPALSHLAENFLRASASPYDGEDDGAIAIMSAAGPYDEARWVAAQCRRLAEGGMRWRDMAVIARDLAKYEHELPAAFARERIPYFFDRREDISALPPAAFLTSALEACRTNYDPAAVFRMLKTGLSPLTPEEVAALENYCFVWNIRGALWLEPFAGNPSGFGEFREEDSAELARVNELRQRVASPLSALREGISHADGRRFSAAVFKFIEDSGALDGLSRLAEEYEKLGDPAAADRLDALWEHIVTTLDRFSATLGGVALPSDGMTRLFALALSSADLGSPPRTLDSVSIGEADRMRPFEPRAVFVVGVSEGVFPMPPASGALFTDPDREQLAKLGLELADTADDQLLAERLFAFSAFSAARERLFVSFPRCDVKGADTSPSVLVGQCAGLFPGLSAQETAALPPEFYLHGPETAYELLAGAPEPTPFSEALRLSLTALPGWRERAARLETVIAPARFALRDGAVAERLFGGDTRLSPSGIESYHSCRFKYFAEYGLRLRERRAAGLSPLETGDLIHEALFRIISKYGARGLCSLSRAKLSAEVDAVLKDCLAAAIGSGESSSKRFTYLYGRLSGFLLRLLLRLAEEFEVCAFEPAAFEQPLADGGDVPPYRLVTPDGRAITVGGRIDRVDILKKGGKKYVRVVDYKSGAKEFALSDVFYGLNLQMLVYLFAVWQGGRGEMENCQPAGILYMPAKDAVITAPRDTTPEDAEALKAARFRMNGLLLDDPDVLSAMEPGLGGVFIPVKATKSGYETRALATLSEIGAIKEHIDGLLRDMSDELLRGEIGAVPSKKSDALPCDYCQFADICRRAADGETKNILTMKKDEFYHAIKGAADNA